MSVLDPPVPSPDWFSGGPLCHLSPLYGRDSPMLSQPGEGTQSWQFCPLISLGLLAVETRLAVFPQEVLTSPQCCPSWDVWLSYQVASFRGEAVLSTPRRFHTQFRHRSFSIHKRCSTVLQLLFNLRLLRCKPTRLSMAESCPTLLRFLCKQHPRIVPRLFPVLDPFGSPVSWRCQATSTMPL